MHHVFVGLVLLASLVGARGQEKKTAKYCLGRVVGSSLPGRHVANQTQISLRDILDQEKLIANDPDVHRFWLLNRIQSNDERESFTDVLAQFPNIAVVHLPFNADVFRSIPLRRNAVHSQAIPGLSRSIADQVRYVTANNEARNAAIDYCMRINATWILPLDGNNLIPDAVWRAIRSLTSVVNDTIILPMKRQGRGQTVSPADIPSRYEEEPQIMFHSTTAAHFNERYMYGHRPKIDMLRRLCVAGYWDHWHYYEARYDMDFDDMNVPCSLRQVAPPSLSMALLRINDYLVSAGTRHTMRHVGMRTAVAHTIANTMFRPQYAFWVAPDKDELRSKETPSSESALKQKPTPLLLPLAERHGLTRIFSKIIESAVRLQVGPSGKALRDERDVIRAWVLDVLLSSQTSLHILREQTCIMLIPYISDVLLYVSRRNDIFKQGERVEIQAWFRRLARMLGHLADKSDQSPAKFQKTICLNWWERSTTMHAAPHVPTSDSMWLWIALLSTSPWVLHDFAEAPAGSYDIFDIWSNSNGTVPETIKGNLPLLFSNAIVELAHIVDISIAVSPVDKRRYVAMGEGGEASEANTLQHLSGLLLAVRLVERHGFNIVNENLCPAVSYFVADRTPAAWQADCTPTLYISILHHCTTSRPVIDIDHLRQHMYSQIAVVCETRPKVLLYSHFLINLLSQSLTHSLAHLLTYIPHLSPPLVSLHQPCFVLLLQIKPLKRPLKDN